MGKMLNTHSKINARLTKISYQSKKCVGTHIGAHHVPDIGEQSSEREKCWFLQKHIERK